MQDQKVHRQKVEEAKVWAQKWKISSLTPRLVQCYERVLAEKNQKSMDDEDENK